MGKVKSAYMELLNMSVLVSLHDRMLVFVEMLWKNNVPSKISIFGWRLLLEKLPTREALFGKGVITNNTERCCVLCSNQEESIHYIFLHCSVTNIVWQKIFNCIRLNIIMTDSVQQHFILFCDLIKGNVNKRYRHII
jgi:hypothetical protein